MTPDDLVVECLYRIATGGAVTLLMPKPTGEGPIRLHGEEGPIGEVFREHPEGVIVNFDAKEVLAYTETQRILAGLDEQEAMV